MNLCAEESEDTSPVLFKQVIPMYDWLMAHKTEPLLGKYLIWNYPNGRYGFKCGLADERTLRDIRFFQLDFIIHHNLSVGIV